ncbi:hypothetical protein Hanom_Chr02g00115881 [Helianthus anomalus]
MVDFKIFDLSVFSCKPALLTYPPEVPNAVDAHVFEQSVDDEVSVTFVVDNVYWAQTHGLDRKKDLTIKDNVGQTWNVAIGKEFSQCCLRFNVTGM